MSDFSAEKMFRMLDLDRDGCFTPGEVREFLEERGIKLEGEEGAQLFADKFDCDRDGRVNF